MSQQVILKQQQLTISEILRTYGKKFEQVRKRYSDGHNGRCAIGVVMSYFGWNGKDDSEAGKKLMETLNELKQAGISKNFVLQLNDSGFTFNKIADYIDTVDNNRF
jgi:hypothetical protein